MSEPKLKLVSLKKEYDNGSVVAVDGVNLSIAKGETVALLGSSGCGKSTTLNMIVGLEQPTSGDIQIDGKSIVTTPAGKRDVGLVFQDYAVFASMTVRKNLAFGLEVRGEGKSVINKAVDEVAELLGMKDKLNARAKDLGGSELQRVAIGRTLVTKPQILLLDEPLSNLEAAARLAMRKELRRLQSEIGLTIIYVTHDQIEALSLADRIAVMRGGKILQVEKTATICERPSHIFVAGFLGSPPMNLLSGQFAYDDQGTSFTSGEFCLHLSSARPTTHFDSPHTLGIRPEAITITAPEQSALRGEILMSEPRGPETVLTVASGNVQLKVITPSTTHFSDQTPVGLQIDPDALIYFNNFSQDRVDVHFEESVQ